MAGKWNAENLLAHQNKLVLQRPCSHLAQSRCPLRFTPNTNVLRPGLSIIPGCRLATLLLYGAWVFRVPGVWTQHNFVPVPTHQVWTQCNLCWAGELVPYVNSVFNLIVNFCNDSLNSSVRVHISVLILYWGTALTNTETLRYSKHHRDYFPFLMFLANLLYRCYFQ